MIYSVAVLRTVGNINDYQSRVVTLINRRLTMGELVTVSGWGYTGFGPGGSGISPTYMQFLSKYYITRANCEQRLGMSLPDSTLCTSSAQGQGSCMGDSGEFL